MAETDTSPTSTASEEDTMNLEEKSKKRSRSSDPNRQRKRRKLWPQCDDPKAIFKCLLFKNFPDEHVGNVKESVLDWISDAKKENPSMDLDMIEVPFEKCRFLQTDDMKKNQKREYRAEYGQRADVLKKKAEKEADPATKQKRAEYAKRPEVKEQKKIRTTARQFTYHLFKKTLPEAFSQIQKDALAKSQEKLLAKQQRLLAQSTA